MHRDEQGSVAMAAIVSMIAITLTAAVLTVIFRDLRVTRRSGDSANALQIADAGINEAVKYVATASPSAATSCPGMGGLPAVQPAPVDLANGRFTYCAAQEIDALGRVTWHIDSRGVDKSGVARRIRAKAVSEPAFPNAIQLLASGAFSSGFSVDSYQDGNNRCTGKGKVGTNDSANFDWNNNGGGSVNNCKNLGPNGQTTGAWKFPPDGCVAYSRNGNETIRAEDIGEGMCPPSNTTTDSPEFSVPNPQPPASADHAGTSARPNMRCPSVPVAQQEANTQYFDALLPNRVYSFRSVSLGEGCSVAATSYPALLSPAKIFATSLSVLGGNGAGNADAVNVPPNSATVCGSTHTADNTWYCPGWPGALQINIIGAGPVTFSGNHGTFWGTVRAPLASVTFGGPSWEIFGSIVAQSFGGGGGQGGVQAKFHYDESLGRLTTGRHFLRDWREEPQ